MPVPMMTPEAAWFGDQLRAAQTETRRAPLAVATQKGGKDLLDVYRAGDVVILRDTDGEFFAKALDKGLDLNWIMDSMYGAFADNFSDDYQYVQFYILRDFGLFFAFYQPVANDILGLGYDSITPGETFDLSTDTQLEGLIFMNYYGMWTEEPAQGRYVFNQEFMHRWGSFTNVTHPDLGENDLLGRDTAHWSYWFDTTNSPMEGNDWVDNGDGTWTISEESGSTYSDLDLYLMGLVGPEDVGPLTFLKVDEAEQTRVGRDPTFTPEYFGDLFDGSSNEPITVTATPVVFSLDDIIAAEGARSPGVADSPKTFRMATVILAFQDDEINDTVLAEIDGLRQTFEHDWEEDVGGRADLDTTLGDGTAATWGEPVDTGGDSGVTDTADTAVSDAEDTGTKEEEPGGCGCASAPSPGWLGLAALTLLWRRRAR